MLWSSCFQYSNFHYFSTFIRFSTQRFSKFAPKYMWTGEEEKGKCVVEFFIRLREKCRFLCRTIKNTNIRPNVDAVLTDRRKYGGSAVDQRTSRESAFSFPESWSRFSFIFSAKTGKTGKRQESADELNRRGKNKTRGGNHQLVAAAVSCLTLKENVISGSGHHGRALGTFFIKIEHTARRVNERCY